MAAIFVSYPYPQTDLAKSVERRLVDSGHRVRIPVGVAAAGNWRTKMTRGLISCDVFVVLLNEAALQSKNVIGEIGAARAMEQIHGMLILPVLVGDFPIPAFVSDFFCFQLKSSSDEDLAELTNQLGKAIADNVRLGPRIFISHRHADQAIAEDLINLLKEAFQIAPSDLRCTSVKPYMLTPGARTSEQLRSDLASAELVIGIIGPDTTESNYVLCELGAAWGRDVTTFPVLARGATFANVPSPLNERHSLSLESADNCLDLVDFVRTKTSLLPKTTTLGTLEGLAKRLANTAKGSA